MSLNKHDWLKLLAGAALVATGAGAAGLGPLAGALGTGVGAAGTAAGAGAAGAAGATAGGWGSLLASPLITSGLGLGTQGAAGHIDTTLTTPGQVTPLPEQDPWSFFEEMQKKTKGGRS